MHRTNKAFLRTNVTVFTADLPKESPVDIRDADGRLVRVIHFGPPGALAAEDDAMGVALRDLWRPRERLQIDAGLRGDTSDLAGFAPSARVGFRYSIGDDSTVVKGGLGTFVGSVPLAAAAFGGFPSRLDHDTDDAGSAGRDGGVGRAPQSDPQGQVEDEN